MKQIFSFLLLSQTIFCQSWYRISDFPITKRDDGVGVIVNNKAYFGTGLQEGFSITGNFAILDLSTQTWSNTSNMPNGTERQYACAFAGPNCFYVFGGEAGGYALNTLYKYDISTNTWGNKSSKPGNGLNGASCMPFGDKVIFVGGKDDIGTVHDEVWEYSISQDAWTQKNNIPFGGRWRASASTLNNSGYLLFGRDNNGSFRKELLKYNPVNDTWTSIMDFPQPKGRAYAALQTINNKLILYGGYDTTNAYYNDAWLYDEAQNSWSLEASMPSFGRKGGMSCSANGKFYYSCGINQQDRRLNETWVLDVPLGIDEKNKTSTFSLFPNPFTDFIYVSGINEKPKIYSYTIHDLMGNDILSKKNIDGGFFEINTQEIRSGIYILRLFSTGNLIGVIKIVKE